MFFVIGVNDRREELDYDGLMTCDLCGAMGRFNVFMVCSVLYLFFIPVFRWNRRYYVETSCCHALYELNSEKGEAIGRGERVEIYEEDLQLLNRGQRYKKCAFCGYQTSEDFDYCPKCGNRF